MEDSIFKLLRDATHPAQSSVKIRSPLTDRAGAEEILNNFDGRCSCEFLLHSDWLRALRTSLACGFHPRKACRGESFDCPVTLLRLSLLIVINSSRTQSTTTNAARGHILPLSEQPLPFLVEQLVFDRFTWPGLSSSPFSCFKAQAGTFIEWSMGLLHESPNYIIRISILLSDIPPERRAKLGHR